VQPRMHRVAIAMHAWLHASQQKLQRALFNNLNWV